MARNDKALKKPYEAGKAGPNDHCSEYLNRKLAAARIKSRREKIADPKTGKESCIGG